MLFNVMVFTYFGWFLWFSKVFSWLHVVSGWFSWFLKVFSWLFMLFKLTIYINDAIFLLNQPDHLMLLFLIVGNYRSNDAMFALYSSSLLNIMQRIGRPLKFPSECSAFEMRANIVLSSHNCRRLTRALKRGGKKQTAHLTKRPKRST